MVSVYSLGTSFSVALYSKCPWNSIFFRGSNSFSLISTWVTQIDDCFCLHWCQCHKISWLWCCGIMLSVSWMPSAESGYFRLNCTSIVLEGSWKTWAGASCSLKKHHIRNGLNKAHFYLAKLRSMGCIRSHVCWIFIFLSFHFRIGCFTWRNTLVKYRLTGSTEQ